MIFSTPLQDIGLGDRSRYGGKAVALADMLRADVQVPGGICVPVEVYHAYMGRTGLRDRLPLLFGRKSFEHMRWEELWDLALRIRNLFLTTPLPEDLAGPLGADIRAHFSGKNVAVRSSSPAEDNERNSFAGLHDSFVNITGESSILDCVRLVWASLWSDRALLYRKELGLHIADSAMAVVIQELIAGDCSGVAFTVSPENRDCGLIEAVYGLNQGLVDGAVEPDRWTIVRETLAIAHHHEPTRTSWVVEEPGGVKTVHLPAARRNSPPLSKKEAVDTFRQALVLESLFGNPQDVEWTRRGAELHVLQARPVTIHDASEAFDQRQWYLSLHRSLDNLKALQLKIEEEILPAMEAEALTWSDTDLSSLSDMRLAEEIERREERFSHWKEVYNREFIPFAHGMRLFGQVYNDRVQPADPFEFMDVLSGEALLAVKRNRLFAEMAGLLRDNPHLAETPNGAETSEEHPRFQILMQELMRLFGDTSWGQTRYGHDEQAILRLVSEMAKVTEPVTTPGNKRQRLEEAFLDRFSASERETAESMLCIGRASYRLRDNDNLYLGRIEGGVLKAVAEAGKRVAALKSGEATVTWSSRDLCRALRTPGATPPDSGPASRDALGGKDARDAAVKVRQAVGQPAGKGVGVGTARVIHSGKELFSFKQGEVLVCDAIDPNMTFIVPLASAVVERRGGMLIHGAIIAREYGIPCVTGVPDATTVINTGDRLSVDGYLGIVVIS